MNSFKFCNKCLKERLTDGGVQTAPTRWMCQACWLYKTQKKAKA